ncbi:hypothetical protein [uncultured Roseibium sp.]|uniref:hypothetical protein n=1 Tax=uncultured Roseibium sp. TaxID=1936171 RepID=UPI003217467B
MAGEPMRNSAVKPITGTSKTLERLRVNGLPDVPANMGRVFAGLGLRKKRRMDASVSLG